MCDSCTVALSAPSLQVRATDLDGCKYREVQMLGASLFGIDSSNHFGAIGNCLQPSDDIAAGDAGLLSWVFKDVLIDSTDC